MQSHAVNLFLFWRKRITVDFVSGTAQTKYFVNVLSLTPKVVRTKEPIKTIKCILTNSHGYFIPGSHWIQTRKAFALTARRRGANGNRDEQTDNRDNFKYAPNLPKISSYTIKRSCFNLSWRIEYTIVKNIMGTFVIVTFICTRSHFTAPWSRLQKYENTEFVSSTVNLHVPT